MLKFLRIAQENVQIARAILNSRIARNSLTTQVMTPLTPLGTTPDQQHFQFHHMKFGTSKKEYYLKEYKREKTQYIPSKSFPQIFIIYWLINSLDVDYFIVEIYRNLNSRLFSIKITLNSNMHILDHNRDAFRI